MSQMPAQPFENLNSIIDELARCNPGGILALDRLIQRLRLAIDPHILSCADLVRSQLPERNVHFDGNSPIEGLSLTVDILQGMLPVKSHHQACSVDSDKGEELDAAFQALRIAFGDDVTLPEDDEEFLMFTAQKLQQIAIERCKSTNQLITSATAP
ncbi:hypothetical protein SISNIDRAFT_488628 [Sistotremastrum niveocremeum HHB9708]|uniref:Uncharacterized protein n=1 Tax=Sistotremastrum niveocremeum HHB9708 TaxID=1314777 RepID=A0A164QYY8_9AGAM|nr:hypothetical protein SISNIDRAFT_488628 [Sistotremastrum niveocremeum HHB9708]